MVMVETYERGVGALGSCPGWPSSRMERSGCLKQALWGRVAVDGTVHVIRQDFPIGRPRRVSPGAKSLFSDGLAPARCCPPPQSRRPHTRHPAFLAGCRLAATETSASKASRQRGGQPGGFIPIWQGNKWQSPPVKSRANIQIEMCPLVQPVDFGFCHRGRRSALCR